jgi:solute carrier family 45 protein 1/2/4
LFGHEHPRLDTKKLLVPENDEDFKIEIRNIANYLFQSLWHTLDMATQAHASPSQEPDASALESLDDLLNKQQTEQGAQLSAGDDPNTTSSSSITITPQSPLRAPRPRDESRWNGFHLWRTESYNRAATERAAEEEEHRREEHGWVKDLEAKVKSVYQRSQEALFGKREDTNETKDGSMSWIKLFLLTVVMAGAQLAWCLEFGYGTPYLLSIGLSKASTSFVWLCAPLSGLVMQPLIGVLSDLSTSSFRRRQYIIYSLIFLIPSTLVIAFSQPIASILVDILHTGLADWDPARKQALDDINRFIAILSFVILDLSINSLQAAARALILDTAPTSQHSRANAWLGRMTHVGNVAGYAAGWYDLSSTKALIWLGGGQFRKYAVVSMVGVSICSITTCVFIKENVREGLHDGQTGTGVIAKSKEALYHIYQAIRRLPRPVRRICLVQLFAFMGWFPFLFYATQWVIEIRQKETDGVGSGDAAAEKGSFALL